MIANNKSEQNKKEQDSAVLAPIHLLKCAPFRLFIKHFGGKLIE